MLIAIKRTITEYTATTERTYCYFPIYGNMQVDIWVEMTRQPTHIDQDAYICIFAYLQICYMMHEELRLWRQEYVHHQVNHNTGRYLLCNIIVTPGMGVTKSVSSVP